ncbi:DUF5753 domain-containing protein [Streptomyces tendae]|uniref:DUF5753 domain-containing protein n=1 Tax=Streptomyces tendae TaxID=1932 RepID=UPI00368C7F27
MPPRARHCHKDPPTAGPAPGLARHGRSSRRHSAHSSLPPLDAPSSRSTDTPTASWWSAYSDIIAAPFAQYLGYESAADTIRAYHPSLIPGLLQTTDYIRALYDAAGANPNAQKNIELRSARQERIYRESDGTQVSMIVDEAALRRLIRGAAVMRNQLSFIKQMATSQRITLRALPFAAGAHDSLDSSFLLLGFQDDEDVLYVAGPNGVLTNRDNREMVARYQECFEDLTDKSLSEEATISLLDELLEQLRDS